MVLTFSLRYIKPFCQDRSLIFFRLPSVRTAVIFRYNSTSATLVEYCIKTVCATAGFACTFPVDYPTTTHSKPNVVGHSPTAISSVFFPMHYACATHLIVRVVTACPTAISTSLFPLHYSPTTHLGTGFEE